VTRAPSLLRVLLLGAALSGCSGAANEAPVATPSMTPSGRDVAAGREVNVTYRFQVAPGAPAFEEDLHVFVHAFDQHGTQVWTADHEPATPTRQWKGAATIEYLRPLLVPRRSPTGVLEVDIGLYSPATGERVPLNGNSRGHRSYRGTLLQVRAPTGDSPAIFMDGWYEPEEASGSTWRWSRNEAEMWFRNPRQDSVLVLEMDGAVPGIAGPRHVEVRAGADLIERFDLHPGPAVRRIRMPAATLGDTDIVRIRTAVDRAQVPADRPEARSRDPRELGVRVFEAYLEPEGS
jgi:hypothetical protein